MRIETPLRALLLVLGLGLGLGLGLASSGRAAEPVGADVQVTDPVFAEHVKTWTTRPEFVTPLVDHLPPGGAAPSPREVLGHDIGAPRVLDHYADLLRYYRTLAARSPRVRIVETGRTEEGRETVIVLISSQANIAKLDTIQQSLRRLGDPRGLSEAEARSLIATTPPIYLILGGLHSAETGPPEMLVELAYRLVAEDSPLIRRIRDKVVVAINPASDPDGRDRYTDWYYRNKIDDVDDLDPVPGPPYWGKYIFHDNNRDINFTGYSARSLLDFYLKWRPPIIHDLHESVPFLYIFSGQPPQNPNLDPILFSELPWFSNFEMAQLTKMGLPGVWDHGYVDAWSPGYVAFMSSNHNGLIRFYETFGNGGATTMLRHVKPVDGPGQDLHASDQTKREWFRPDPPYATVEWSMRDNTNFMETGMLTALQTTATFPEQILENFYRKSRNALEDGAKPPYAFIIPADQKDMTRAELVINLLRLQGIEVGQLPAAVTLKEGTFPAGSLVVRRDQPYGRLAKTLLEKQVYPDPKLRTYDDSGWTMGLLAGVKVVATADPKAEEIKAPLIATYTAHAQEAPAGAPLYVIPDVGSPNLARLRFELRSADLRIAEAPFTSAGRSFPAGSFLVRGADYERVRAVAEPLGLELAALAASPGVPAHPAALPRIGVFSTWGATQNVGWVRYGFDQFKTPYDLLFKDEVRKGGLRGRYDVIVIPSQQRSAKAFLVDVPVRGRPLPYDKTPQYPTQGAYGSSPDIRGGIGLEGLQELRRFVEAGGLLVTLGDASAVPAEFGLAPEVDVSAPSKEFYAPGPIVEARILAPLNPVFYGYSEPKVAVRWASANLLSAPAREQSSVLMDFPGGKAGVLSGLMTTPDEIKKRPAVIEQSLGSGRILMFATNPMYRWQNFGEFRMLFNALINWRSLDLGRGPGQLRTSPEPSPEAPEGGDVKTGG